MVLRWASDLALQPIVVLALEGLAPLAGLALAVQLRKRADTWLLRKGKYSKGRPNSVMFFPLNAKQILWLRARPRQGSRTKKGYRTLTYTCTHVRAGLETVAAIYLD